MAQKFLSIKNFEKYQHYKHRNPPWIRLYRSLFNDRDFIKLSIPARYLYIGLLTLCSEHANRVPMDCAWIAHRLCIHESEVDLTPLYKGKFLLASRNHVASVIGAQSTEDSESSLQKEKTEDSEAERASAQPRTNEVWVESLKHDPAYSHINLEHELAKMDVWLRANPGRQKSRKFVLNWLNKIDKPLPASDRPIQAAIPPKPPKNDPIGRGLWDRAYGHLVKEQA